jgi:DNA-binding CsgD family transcriptional regulator
MFLVLFGLAVFIFGRAARRAAKGETPYAIAKALGIDRHTAVKYARST